MSNPVVRRARGFTLVELAVVVVILGVLAAFGVPRFMDSVERGKASEAFTFLSTVRQAQERHQVRQGTYAARLDALDMSVESPVYFSVGSIVLPTGASLETAWQLTLTRKGASAGYGAYTVVYNQSGWDASKSTIPDAINPRQTGTSTSSGSSGSSATGTSASSGSTSSGSTSGSSSGSGSGGEDAGGSKKGSGGKKVGQSDGKGKNG